MASPPSRESAHVIESIAKKALAVKEAAAALTDRIERFQEYLGNLPGRVETVAYGSHPDYEHTEMDGLASLALKLHREGKEWILSYGLHREDFAREDQNYSVDYKQLLIAPLTIKMAALKIFPNMLSAIEESQDALVAHLKKAAEEFDQFATSLVVGRAPNTDTLSAAKLLGQITVKEEKVTFEEGTRILSDWKKKKEGK